MGRMITSNIWEDDFIVSLSFFNRLVWIGLITIADDQGRMQDSANLIRSKMFPMYDVPLKDIEGALIEFCKAGKITRYIAENKKLIQIVHWWKHQRPQWAGKSIFPAPPAWTDRIRCHIKGNTIQSLNWESEGGYIVGYIAPYIAPEVKREVKGEVEGEEEVKGDDEVQRGPLFQANTLSTTFEKAANILAHNPQKWMKAIDAMQLKGATPEDITDAVNELRAKGYNIIGPWSIENAVINVMGKRKSRSTITAPAGYTEYIPGD